MSGKKKGLSKSDYFDLLSTEINEFKQKAEYGESLASHSVGCGDIFDSDNLYVDESDYIKIVLAPANSTTQQGDSLEELIKRFFRRVKLVHTVNTTNKEISLGQIDIQITPMNEMLYDLLGIPQSPKPQFIMGECKNYQSSHNKKIPKEDVEKSCWRTLKGNCITFLFGYGYTQDALDEIGYYNSHVSTLCPGSKNSRVVPITISMLECIIDRKINFCYFLRWSIEMSRQMSINNYIRDLT